MSNHERESSRSPDGDAALDRAWQQLSDEQPPPSLDAAIIAAAHKSIQGRDEQTQVVRASRPYRSWPARWQPLAAAAAVAGLAFVLVQSLPRDRYVAPSLRTEEPATSPAAAQEKPGSPATRESIAAKTASPPASAGARESITAPAGRIGQKLEADTVTTMRATEVEQRQLAAAEMSGRTASEAATAPAPVQTTAAKPAGSAAREDVAQPDATDRAARIASLHAAGDIAGAADALREFRAVDPGADTYLPESLRDWARTVE
jgi:negative regulator of sigma E activity